MTLTFFGFWVRCPNNYWMDCYAICSPHCNTFSHILTFSAIIRWNLLMHPISFSYSLCLVLITKWYHAILTHKEGEHGKHQHVGMKESTSPKVARTISEVSSCWGLTRLAKLDTSYCRKPCWWRVLLAHWYISAVTSSAGTVTSPRCTCLNSWVPRSKVSWYRDTWSSHTFNSSDNSFSQDSTLCLGRPNMTSTDTLPGHSLLASSMVCKACWQLWSLPSIFKSSSCKDWRIENVI